MKVRTRYAPSPTGFFHIGGARTAIYSYLYAKHNNGEFIVRIEDTDIERNIKDGIESQLDNIKWLSFFPDESILNPGKYGPYKQSEKIDRYKELCNSLIKNRKAYYCFCSKELLDEDRRLAELNHTTPKYIRRCLKLTENEIEEKLKNTKPIIRLKMDEDIEYKWNDIVRGEISIPGSALTDPAILKSNGIAMYNFAVVVDDYDMDITHVLRGEEHISNTPYQIAIKNALGFDTKEINYGHLSIIINDDGRKLSKRDSNLKQFIEDFKNMGYLPIAVFNFLVLLGWSPKDNVEISTIEELIKKFDYKWLTKAPAKYDLKKLDWISNQHIKKMSDDEFYSFHIDFVKSNNKFFLENKKEVLLLFKNQLNYANQLDDLIYDIFEKENYKEEEFINTLKENKEYIKIISPALKEELFLIKEWDINAIKNIINIIKDKTGLSGKELFMSIRILTTKNIHGPELAKIIYLLSKKEVILNIEIITKILSEFRE